MYCTVRLSHFSSYRQNTGNDWQHAEEFEKQQQQYREQSSNARGQRNQGFQAEGDFSDFFESMFGGASGSGRGRQVKYRGEDFNAELHLEFMDACKTHKQTLTVNGASIRITIPAGIENGQTIKIAGHGGAGINGGPNGNLFITFTIANHPVYKSEGEFGDLFITYTIKIPTNLTLKQKELFTELSKS